MARTKQSLEPNRPQQGERERERQGGLAHRQSYPSALSGSPFALMNRFAEEMDRVFEDFGLGRGLLAPRFGRGWGEMGQSAMAAWSPQIEAFERGGQFIVRADLPGLTKDDVKVEIHDDALTIQGERKLQSEEEREGFYRSERSYGSFLRSIPLPEGIKADEAKANFRDGVLEITMPAPPRAESRRSIEIK
jgi:HSP20 family protein